MSNETHAAPTYVNDWQNSLIVALVTGLLASILIVTYAPCIVVILRNPKYYRNASYQFIVVLALCDFIQLICGGVITAAFQMQANPKTHFVGAFSFAAYYGSILAVAVLAIERLFKV